MRRRKPKRKLKWKRYRLRLIDPVPERLAQAVEEVFNNAQHQDRPDNG